MLAMFARVGSPAALRTRSSTVPTRLPRSAPTLSRRRFKGEGAPAEAAPSGEHAQQDTAAPRPKPRYKNAHLIFNPAAGQENPATILGDISLKLSEQMRLTVLQTQKDGPSPQEMATQALKEGADVVLVSGGDGTVGAVAGALVDTGVPMGVIPRGTANAFSVALGIPTHIDDPLNFAVQAAEVILQGHTVDVDTALVSTSEVEDYHMILLLGIGYEAETVAQADRSLKDALGPLAYVVAGAKNLVSAKNFNARVWVDGQEAEGEVAAITIANAAPPFSVLAHGHTGECIYDDGKLEAIGYVAAEGGVVSPVVNAVNMVRLFTGIMFSDEPVQAEDKIFGGRYKDIRVECDPPQKVVLDGELLGETPVHARVKPASLKVLVPPPPPEVQAEPEGADTQADADAAEGGDVGGASAAPANEEGSGSASKPHAAPAGSLVEASARVEDKPIVAHEPKK